MSSNGRGDLRAIAFDFDGVLAESVNVKTRAFEKIFSAESPENLRQILDFHLQNGGVSRFEKMKIIHRDILKRPLSEERFQALCRQFADLVIEEVVRSRWVEGAREFLTGFQDQFLYFVVSGTPEDELRVILQRRNMQHFFKEVLGAPLTKTAALTSLLKTYRLSPSELLFVGDAPTDWKAAQETGVQFVWRRCPEGVPPSDGFKGPTLSSLHELGGHLTARFSSHA